MESLTTVNRLKLVDTMLTNMREAGYDVNQETVALVWKTGRGEASHAEIKAWTNRMAAKLSCQPDDPALHLMLARMTTQLLARIDQVKEAMSSMQHPYDEHTSGA